MAVSLVKVGAWKRLRMMLDPARYKKELDKNIRKATQMNAMIVVKEIRARIKKGGYSPNAGLTVLIKGSSKPIIGVGDNELFKAITYQMVSDYSAFVGVLRTTTNKDGEPMVDIAGAIHEGTTIAVSEAMRGMFLALASATRPGGNPDHLEGRAKEIFDDVKGRGEIRPLKPSTTAIIIPGRPFIQSVFEDPKIQLQIANNWRKAVGMALQGNGGGGSAAPPPAAASGGGSPKIKKSKSAKHIAAGKLGWARRKAKGK